MALVYSAHKGWHVIQEHIRPTMDADMHDRARMGSDNDIHDFFINASNLIESMNFVVKLVRDGDDISKYAKTVHSSLTEISKAYHDLCDRLEEKDADMLYEFMKSEKVSKIRNDLKRLKAYFS